MKRLHSLAVGLMALAAAGLSSCGSARYYEFAAQRSAYHAVASTPAPIAAPAELPAVTVAAAPVAATEPVLEASTAPAQPIAAPEAKPAAENRLSAQLKTARTERQLTRAQERRYERVLQKVRTLEARQEAAGQQVDAAELILAIIIPPVGVLLHEGGINSKFWISLLLTLLFWLPGMIYSVLVVTDSI